MKSELPKVLVPASGRPLIDYVLDAIDQAGIRSAIVVIGYRGADVQAALAHRAPQRPALRYVEQTVQSGTGHAVQVCTPLLAEHQGPVLIVTGDSPMVQSRSLRALLDLYEQERPACVLGTLIKDDPTGLGRIVRDERGEFLGIVEQKDATPAQSAIREVNMSTYIFHGPDLLQALAQMKNNNRQGEYYITDCPGILKAQGADVRALAVLDPCEALSVNTVDDLQAVEAELERRQVSGIRRQDSSLKPEV